MVFGADREDAYFALILRHTLENPVRFGLKRRLTLR